MKSSQSGLSPLVIVVIAVVILGIGGYFYFQNSQKTGTGGKQPRGSVVSSIKDALSKSLTLKCEYPDEQGNKTVTYIKGGAVRAVTTSAAGVKGNVLLKENTMYTWEEGKKEGMMFKMEAEAMAEAKEDVKEMEKSDSDENQRTEYLNKLEQYKDYCKPATVSGSLFNPPADVKFVDLQEQMKGSGVDMEKMMQQYQVTPTQ